MQRALNDSNSLLNCVGERALKREFFILRPIIVNSQTETASSVLLIHHLCSQKFNNIQQSAIINHVSFGLHSLTAAVFSSHALVSTLGYLSGSSSWCVLVHVRCLLELEPVVRVDGGAFACFLIENKLTS